MKIFVFITTIALSGFGTVALADLKAGPDDKAICPVIAPNEEVFVSEASQILDKVGNGYVPITTKALGGSSDTTLIAGEKNISVGRFFDGENEPRVRTIVRREFLAKLNGCFKKKCTGDAVYFKDTTDPRNFRPIHGKVVGVNRCFGTYWFMADSGLLAEIPYAEFLTIESENPFYNTQFRIDTDI